jgi:PKD repeat protein
VKTCLIVLLVFFLLPVTLWADGIKKVDQPQGIPSFLGYVPDRLILVMKTDVGDFDVQMTARAVVHIGEPEFDKISDRFAVSSIRKQFPGSERKSAELARYYKIAIEAGTLNEAMEAYRSHPMVEKVEPIGIHAMYATPSDFYYSYQWHLNQASDHDIDAPEAWDIEAGADATIVAILDSGTRYYHPDLGGVNASPSNPGASRGNMWINNAELNGSSGADDDGNGYVDDWIGYDFIQSTTSCWSGEDCGTKDNDPRDFNGHGTHTSGIFGMITNDGYGMCGVAGGWGNGTQTQYGNGVRIMALRMGYSYNYLGQEYGVVLMDAAAEAFYYAADNGARIASCSWGSSNSGGIGAAATYFLNSGGLIFVAAGNDGAEVSPDYLNGRGDCISVAATDENDNGASFTTYGTWVDICAPGNNIYSTYHDHTDPNTNYWAAMGGTSMATPMAAGVAALIWSHNPSWTAAQVKNQLYSSADNIDAYLSSKYIGKMGAGRINAYNAVNTGPPPPPVAQFSGSPTSGTEPLTVNFTDLSTGSITSWSWTFGDGGTSSAQHPSHVYAAGTYTVSLTVTGPGGSDGETKTNYIAVNPCVAPVADFVGSPRSGDYPLTVDFSDLSTNSPTSWSWTFGDGGTSTAQNPSHTYTSAGNFTVSLTATNPCGSDGETKAGYIMVTEPSVEYAALPYSTGFESGAFDQYWFTQSSNSEGRILITTANGPHSGSYHMTMDDNTSGGQYAQNEAWLRVNLAGQGQVDLEFWWKEFGDETHSQDGVYFSNNGGASFAKVQDLNGGSYSNNTWYNFGLDLDQLAASAGLSLTSTFVIKFQQYDNYPISTDGFAFDDISVTAGGVPPPVAAFSGSPTSGCAPLTVNFTDQSTGDITSWDWNFGDGTAHSAAQNPSHQYANPGDFTVTLAVTGPGGSDSEVKTNYIHVEGAPVAAFYGDPTSGTVPLTVSFHDQSTGTVTSWDWNFGDGTSHSSAQNPTHQYSSAGLYTVTLTVTGPCGSDGETKSDYINVTEAGAWTVITYDDFESGWGSYTDGGGDCSRYTRSTYAHQGRAAADIQDNSGTASSFYHTAGYNVSGYTELEVEFWFYAVSMESGEDFWVQYYDGSTWRTVATFARGTSFNNNTFYNPVVTISSSQYNFPSNARLRFMCDASDNNDDVYIDEIEFRGMSGTATTTAFAKSGTGVPEKFALSQNYPNPFNPVTRFTLDLIEQSQVSVVVYNIAGQSVKTLVDEVMSAGSHTLTWDGTNDRGEALSSGVYLYRAVAGNEVLTRKMTLLK